jgi:hypothetical protein
VGGFGGFDGGFHGGIRLLLLGLDVFGIYWRCISTLEVVNRQKYGFS